MNFIEISSQIVSYVRNNSPQNSRSSWVKWRGLVEQIYEFDYSISEIKRFINKGKGSFKKNVSNENDIVRILNNISSVDLIRTIELIKLYLEIENENQERLNIKYQNGFWNLLCENLKLTEEQINNTNFQIKKWFEKDEDKGFFTPINISATLLLINLDFVLRWFSLWVYQTEKLELWFGETSGISEGWFYSSQFMFIPAVILSVSVVRRKWITKKTTKLFEELNLKKFKLRIKKDAWNIALVFVYAISGLFIQDTLHDNTGIVVLSIMLLLYSSYLLFILSNFSIRYPHPKEVISQLEALKETSVSKELSFEENDIEIINLEVKLRSLNEQMEAFVLEAALFGALAFSGFLSIISSDIFEIEGVTTFSHNIDVLLSSFVNFDVSNNKQILNALLSKEGLLSLLSYQTLFCAIFFFVGYCFKIEI